MRTNKSSKSKRTRRREKRCGERVRWTEERSKKCGGVKETVSEKRLEARVRSLERKIFKFKMNVRKNWFANRALDKVDK